MATKKSQDSRSVETGAAPAGEELSQAVLNSLLAHIAVLDREGNIITVNESWRRFAVENGGATTGTDVGTNYLEVCRAVAGNDDSAREVFEGVRDVLDGTRESFTVEYSCHSPEEERWFLLNATPLPGGRGGAVVSHVNITERKRDEATLVRRSREAALGADIGAALSESDTLPAVLQRCCEAMVRHLDAAFARVWTFDEAENVLELRASAGLYAHLDGPHSRVPVGKFKIGLIAEERKPHLTNQVVGDPRVGDQEWARREGMVSFAGYPLIVEGRLAGVMAMFARHKLADHTLDALASAAQSIAQGVQRRRAEDERARLREEMIGMQAARLEELSTPLIPLTGQIVIMPLVGTIDSERAARVLDAVSRGVVSWGARVAIIDITGVPTVDSHVANALAQAAQAVRLLGAEVVLTGIRARVAQTLVEMGIDFQQLVTRKTLQNGVEYAREYIRATNGAMTL